MRELIERLEKSAASNQADKIVDDIAASIKDKGLESDFDKVGKALDALFKKSGVRVMPHLVLRALIYGQLAKAQA